MVGPPGSRETILAKRMATVLRDLKPDESIEITRIDSAVGCLQPARPQLAIRPFRPPYRTISRSMPRCQSAATECCRWFVQTRATILSVESLTVCLPKYLSTATMAVPSLSHIGRWR